jgi:hypothetical protein
MRHVVAPEPDASWRPQPRQRMPVLMPKDH